LNKLRTELANLVKKESQELWIHAYVLYSRND